MAVYTFPEVASVGINSVQAAQQGIPVKIGHFPVGHLGKAQASGEDLGFVMVIRHRHDGTLLGMHMIGPHATEIIEVATAMIGQRASAADLGQMVFAHPTISEAVKEAAEDAFDLAIHLPARRAVRLVAEVKDIP
jgi:dihydrolipoamide dehydrogenase